LRPLNSAITEYQVFYQACNCKLISKYRFFEMMAPGKRISADINQYRWNKKSVLQFIFARQQVREIAMSETNAKRLSKGMR